MNLVSFETSIVISTNGVLLEKACTDYCYDYKNPLHTWQTTCTPYLYLNYKTLFAEILCNSLWWKLWNLILCEKGWLCWNITHAYPIIDGTESSGTKYIGQITWSGIASKNENRHNTKFVATGGTVVCHYEGIVPSHLVLKTLGK